MNKEQENQFKKHIKEMAREEIQRTFIDNLMETLNSAFIFKYVETLELKCKKQKEVIDKAIEYILKETKSMPVNGCTIRLEDLLNILKGSDKQ